MKQANLEGGQKPIRPKERFWLTPPELVDELVREFGQLYDPCPHPRPEGFDGMTADWGSPAYCNPPFGAGTFPSAWTKKAIKEVQKGKTVLFVIPAYLNRELERAHRAGAVLRQWGCVHWLSMETGKPSKHDLFVFLAVWQ